MMNPVDPRLSHSAPQLLREKAAEMETAFLAQMLGAAGLVPATSPFGGGIGEEQFASFQREAQAKAMVQAGGIGLTEALFRAMGGVDDAT